MAEPKDIRSPRFARQEMTQPELTERIGVTQQTVIAIEQGRYSPSLGVCRVVEEGGCHNGPSWVYMSTKGHSSSPRRVGATRDPMRTG